MRRPDIVFVLPDQLSAKWVEAALAGAAPLPNIERLQRMGIRFSRAITSNPVCCPARATLATGLATRGHGVLENGYQLDPALPTFPQALQRAGWRTGAFGKVHFQPHYRTLMPDWRPYGFEDVRGTEDPRGGEWLDWVEREHPEHYDAALATVWAHGIPGFADYGPGRRNLRERILRIRASFAWATPEFPLADSGHYPLPFPEEVSQTCWITSHAERFIRETPADRPLLAHIGYVQPHSPFCAPADCMKSVDPARIPEPAGAEWRDAQGPRALRRQPPDLPADWRFRRHVYFADLAHLDRQLGRILDALDSAGRLRNTFLFFLSDHGELLHDHGFRNKANKHYDACIRVPLIVAGPGLEAGRVCNDLVQLEDLCPTVLEAAGLRLPPLPAMGRALKAEPRELDPLPGRSLLPLCRGERPADWRDAAYCESYNTIHSADPGLWARTVRTRRWRYTFYPQGNGEQLFDLDSDPDEQVNRVAHPEFTSIRREMRDRLMEQIVMQDQPKTRRALFALGVH